MSYLDPLGGHSSSGDFSSGADDDGPDNRSRARHNGAAPDPYAPDRFSGGHRDPEPGDSSYAEHAPDPYAAFRESAGGSLDAVRPSPADSSADPEQGLRGGRDPQAPGIGDAREASAPSGGGSAGEPDPRRGGPAAYPAQGRVTWDAPAAAPPPEVIADPGPPRRRGRRRAGRDGTPTRERRTGRAGRNLRAAIVVGASLVVLVLASLTIWKPAFLGVVAAAAGVGIWEMVRAVRVSGANPPLIPLLGGGLLMTGLAWHAGPDALSLGLLVTVLAAMVWRLGDGPKGFQRDLAATVLIAVYVPFLLGFGVLLVKPDDGPQRVLASLLVVVLSDTGGYAAGVFFGKHKMAPLISPGKSWEGFAGSVAAAAIGGALLLYFMLDVPLYWGALFGMVIAVVAVLGDLAESMIKRDLGLKDMSQLLPGHGGLMDRLDSILFAVPTAYLLLSLIAPTE